MREPGQWHLRLFTIPSCSVKTTFRVVARPLLFFVFLLVLSKIKNRKAILDWPESGTLLRLYIPFLGIARPQPQFHIHVSVSDLYIPRIGPHISSSRKGRPIVEIYNSLTDTWIWKLGLRPRYSFSGNICFKFSAFCLCSVPWDRRGYHFNRLIWKLDRKATKLLIMIFAYCSIVIYFMYLPYLRMTSWWFLKMVSKMRSGLVGFRWGITIWFQISMQSSLTNKNK